MILRERLDNPFALEWWNVDRWEDAIDLWWQTRQEVDYREVSEEEAMSELPGLSKRQVDFRERIARETEVAQQRKIDEEAAALARRNELNDWTALERGAIALHELFKALTTAGFTEDQALTVVSRTIRDSRSETHHPAR